MKKGFTLIELLAVITILALLAILTSVSVTTILKNTKDDLSTTQMDLIKSAAEVWGADNPNKVPRANDCLYLELSDLKEAGLIDSKIVDSKTNKEIPDTLKIKVSSRKGDHDNTVVEYEVNPSDTSSCEMLDEYLQSDEPQPEPEPEVPEPKSFAIDTWETVVKAVHDGNTSKYKVGDTKTVTLKGGEFDGTKEYTVRIANTSTPADCEDSTFSQTACGFVVEFVDIISKYAMNSSSMNAGAGGWPASEMYTYVKSDIYNALPQELQDGIINTRVVSGHEKGVSTNHTTTDKLYLLSGREIYQDGGSNNSITTIDAGWNNTRQLDYYEQKEVSTTNYSEAIKKYDGIAYSWWLRVPASNELTISLYVTTDGSWNGCGDSVINGVAPAFRLG